MAACDRSQRTAWGTHQRPALVADDEAAHGQRGAGGDDDDERAIHVEVLKHGVTLHDERGALRQHHSRRLWEALLHGTYAWEAHTTAVAHTACNAQVLQTARVCDSGWTVAYGVPGSPPAAGEEKGDTHPEL